MSTKTGSIENKFAGLNLFILILMGIYVLINPFQLTAPSNICLYLSVFALLILIFTRNSVFSLRSPLTLPFTLFSLWAILGLFFTLDFDNTLHDLWIHLLNYLIVFYLLTNYFNSQKKLEALSVIVISGATAFALETDIIYYFIDGFPFSERIGIGANFEEMPCINIGFIVLPAIVLALNRLMNNKAMTNTILCTLALGILFITAFLTQSRGTLLGLFAALIILCVSNKKFIFAVAPALVLLFLIPGLMGRFNFEKTIHDERNKTNRLAIEVIKMHPIVGLGFGMRIYPNPNLVDLDSINNHFPVEYRQVQVIRYPHNTIMDIAVRTGIIGLLLYLNILFVSLLLLWKIFRLTKNQYVRSWSISLSACVTSFSITGLFTDSTFGAKGVTFYIMLAMIVILWDIVQKETALEITPT